MISMSDDDFDHLFKLLNALSGNTYAWNQTSAKKEHIDQFGKKINPGDVYYKRQYGNSYSQELKLSRQSMENILTILFHGSLQLRQVGEHFFKIEQDKILSCYKNIL
ncbi:hypothetical protein G3N56_19405 [Desulfovibrio sulfodismutans]|uniref:Uncharacterized protein n=1 Tax=Desulfolutivibrio sulfodismutans TaxID=63561 RepID=A0A7K3NRU1_9BACT|nr:hypothetical protein [Desulfolutivibrio sulfodismutans]NDY58908.1 hypothetical protein [Desulfolutivibrio sulfodismutans]QLA12823.1 hypothetical protein GD606_11365 [Desulfolutivibrio sulfodismutans DSM 3696]